MLFDTLQSIKLATRNVFSNWRAILPFAVVYLSLLAVLYSFVVIREANLFQVTMTFALAIVAPLLFFVLQAMIANASAEESGELRFGPLVKRSLGSFWKLIVITLPLIAVAILLAYLLAKLQTRLGTSGTDEAAEIQRRMSTTSAGDASKPIDWKVSLLSTIRYLIFGLFLPLAAIHFWLATAREGLVATVKKILRLFGRAFAPQSVLIYILGFIVFAVIPYFLLFRTTPTKYGWLEIFLLVARLAVVFAFTLFGWVITVKALSLMPTQSQSRLPTEAA